MQSLKKFKDRRVFADCRNAVNTKELQKSDGSGYGIEDDATNRQIPQGMDCCIPPKVSIFP
jgi:hypothetical protein